MASTGIQILLDMLVSAGVDTIFGNPGATELPLNDALVDDQRFRYILGLQEVPVMSMADGYSMAGNQLGVVNLHICPGLGNAMGMRYNAYREGTPLLVTAGQQDRRLSLDEPILGGDMLAVTKPWTKCGIEVDRIEDLPMAIKRCIQAALTPPTGPVFLSLPVDLQMELGEFSQLPAITLPNVHTRPPRESIEQAVALLATAANPAIIAGSRLVECYAENELVLLAEAIGAPVYVEPGTTHGRLPIRSDHPLNAQGLPPWAPGIKDRLSGHDVILVTGMDLFRLYIYMEPSNPIPDTAAVIHIDEDPRQIGKNHDVTVGVVGHSKVALSEITDLFNESLDDVTATKVQQRTETLTANLKSNRQSLQAEVDSQLSSEPLTPLGLMGAIGRVLPEDVAVIEEAVTTTNTTLERLGVLQNTTGYFGHRGWGLGWGLGCTLGAQLAWPDRPVLGILGEGSAMYGIQGLWSAARYNIPATFLICNNAQYHILKVCGQTMGLPQASAGEFEGLDLVQPDLDVVAIARGFGVEAIRVNKASEVSDALRDGLASDRPLLIDVPITRETKSELNYG